MSYNFNPHSVVTIENPTTFVSNQTLNVYGIVGKLIKTISTKKSIYINEELFKLTTEMFNIVLPQFNIKPLKFVIAH